MAYAEEWAGESFASEQPRGETPLRIHIQHVLHMHSHCRLHSTHATFARPSINAPRRQDAMLIAEAGSGKTLAYLLPLLDAMLEEEAQVEETCVAPHSPSYLFGYFVYTRLLVYSAHCMSILYMHVLIEPILFLTILTHPRPQPTTHLRKARRRLW